MADGDTGEEAVDLMMWHVRAEHGEEWFEVEEIYQAACRAARENTG